MEPDDQRDTHAALTIPNIITMIRIAATPLFIILLIQDEYQTALVLFLLAGLSDLVDGLIARTWRQKSPLGAYLDPLADKLLLSSSFLARGYFQKMPAWLAVIVISRDVLIVGGIVSLKLFDLQVVIQPERVSKWATAFQILAVFFVLWAQVTAFPPVILWGCFYVTAALTVYSGFQYLGRGLRILNHNS